MTIKTGWAAALACAALHGWTAQGAEPDFRHELKSAAKPWSAKPFLSDPEEFHFAVIGDRTGGERKGVFEKTRDTLNLLRPEFTMSVGDILECASSVKLETQWKALRENFIDKLDMPFFNVIGNHDVWTGFTGMTPRRRESIDEWVKNCGTNTYYSFVYKGCHFVCFNTMEKHDYFPPREPIPENQISWALAEMEKHGDARWHFLFMHKPLDWTSDRWLAFERKINRFNYSVFCGDWHNFCTATRHGKKYYMLGTCGGGWDYNLSSEDLRAGVTDAIAWVTVTKDKGPVVSYVKLSGVLADPVQTCATTKGWIETPLDYPSHLSENPANYAGETNTALIPADVMQGPGYDWHFRHAIILRQGLVYASGVEKFQAGRKRVVLLGDETASAQASAFGDGWQVFDLGFAGDRIENVLWRVQQGTLRGYSPDLIVLSVGKNNAGANTPDEIAAGKRKLLAYVRAAAPGAEIRR